MSLLGTWRVIETPGHNMVAAGSYILLANDGGEFAIGYLSGSIHGACEGDAVEFDWEGNDEMERASGNG
jgi:hypothetical protein